MAQRRTGTAAVGAADRARTKAPQAITSIIPHPVAARELPGGDRNTSWSGCGGPASRRFVRIGVGSAQAIDRSTRTMLWVSALRSGLRAAPLRGQPPQEVGHPRDRSLPPPRHSHAGGVSAVCPTQVSGELPHRCYKRRERHRVHRRKEVRILPAVCNQLSLRSLIRTRRRPHSVQVRPLRWAPAVCSALPKGRPSVCPRARTGRGESSGLRSPIR